MSECIFWAKMTNSFRHIGGVSCLLDIKFVGFSGFDVSKVPVWVFRESRAVSG